MPRVLVVLCAAIVLTGAIAVAVFGRPGPSLDPEREQAVRTAVETHLEQNHWQGVLAARYEDQRVLWICATEVIEANREQSEIGMRVLCDEYAAINGELLYGSGESMPVLATVTTPPDAVAVLSVRSPPDGAGNAEWIEDHFSWLGVKKLHRFEGGDLQDETVTKALSAFGLPADAPVRPRS
ncbi:hypothetical protein [Lentzea sp. NPDC051838]|uniref:hypothetical protein n=1 Tax=Lentzea sp. NPDC051838 TaxID=3154849 RepID=UPI0034474349